MGKRILVIKLSPINGLNSSMMRALALVKGFVENDYDVELLTIRASSTTVIDDIAQYDFLDHVSIVYATANQTYDKIVSKNKGIKAKFVSILRKLYHTFSLYDYTYSIAKKININVLSHKEYDYVVSISDPKPAHIAMNKLIGQGLKYGKWCEYWGDPMAIDITNKSIYPRFIYKRAERRLFNKCDSIIYTSPFTLLEQKNIYPSFGQKMKYVPTAYINEKKYPNHAGVFTIGYFGAYNSKVRDIRPLYEACKGLGEKVRLTIVGNSDLQLEPTEQISVFPRGNVSKYEAETDLLVCILNSSGTQIPGKVYHYAATNRPILILLDGERKHEMRDFFGTFDRYEMCNNVIEDIVSKITELMTKRKEVEPCKEFSACVVAERFLE